MDLRVPNMHMEYLTKISSKWRVVHILVYCVIICTSAASCITFSVSDRKFRGKCFLFSEVVIQDVNSGTFEFVRNNTNSNYTRFGRRTSCKVCIFTSIASSALAVVWMIIFFICVPEKRGSSGWRVSLIGPWKLVPPAAVFSICAALCCTGADIFMTIGLSHFCNSFKKTSLKSCEKAQWAKWNNFTRVSGFYSLIIQILFSSWVMAISWWLQFFLCCLRVLTMSDHIVAKEREHEYRKRNIRYQIISRQRNRLLSRESFSPSLRSRRSFTLQDQTLGDVS